MVDDKFNTNLDLTTLVGELVLMRQTKDNRISLHRVSYRRCQPVLPRADESDAVSLPKLLAADINKCFGLLSRECDRMVQSFEKGHKK